MMKRKIIVVGIVVLLIISGMTFLKIDTIVEAVGGEDSENFGINTSYIKQIAENLSDIIINEYGEGELAKGRAFGSKGEHFAAGYIKLEMQNRLNLYNVTLDPIEYGQNTNLEIKSKGLYINGTEYIEECFITPQWNNSVWPWEDPPDSGNFSYENLKIRKIPPGGWIEEVICATFETLLEKYNDGTINDLETLIEYLIEQIEDYHGFIWAELNETTAQNLPWMQQEQGDKGSDFVYIEENPYCNPDIKPPEWQYNISPYSPFTYFLKYGSEIIHMLFWWRATNCKGLIRYDFNNDTYDMMTRWKYPLPTLYVNKSKFKPIYEDTSDIFPYESDDYTIDYWVDQHWNTSVTSYNVIGQINGTDTSKTVIIDGLYDGWWGTASADSAIGVGIVLAIAKYFKDNNITPKYNLKFIAFGGEEYGFRGAYSHEAKYPDTEDETLVAVIDFNQLGFRQTDPPQFLNIMMNNDELESKINAIVDDTNFVERNGDVTGFRTRYLRKGAPSNGRPFAENCTGFNPSRSCDTFCFLKDMDDDPQFRWLLHHRSGLNYTEGDSMKYYDSNEVNLTAEMAWNVTKYFTVDPDCWFDGDVSYQAADSPNDGDIYNDSINATIAIKSSIPHDLIQVKAIVKKIPSNDPVLIKNFDLIIAEGSLNTEISVTLPPNAYVGNYNLTLELYNSTGRINEKTKSFFDCNDYSNDTDSHTGSFYLHPRGNINPNTPQKPSGNTNIQTDEENYFNSSTTDSNDDYLQYEWAWRADRIIPELQERDLIEKSYVSGELCTVPHTYRWRGDKQIKVRAREDYSYMFDDYYEWGDYGEWTDWSEGLDVTVSFFAGFALSATPRISPDPLETAVNQSTQFYGYAFGGDEPYNWSWSFDSLRAIYNYSYEQNPVHVYNKSDNYTVTLTVTDNDGYIVNYSHDVDSIILKADFNKSIQNIGKPFEMINFFNNSLGDNQIVNWTWNFDDDRVHYNESNVSYDKDSNHTYMNIGEYNISLTVVDNESNNDTYYEIIEIIYDFTPPLITSVSYDIIDSETKFDVILGAAVKDAESGVKNVTVNITYPNYKKESFNMGNAFNDTYFYVFNDTWKSGEYYYHIWTIDSDNNSIVSDDYSFSVPSVFGYYEVGNNSEYINDRITGTVFTVDEYCTADSITAFINQNYMSPGPYKCMIYRANDSKLIGNTSEDYVSLPQGNPALSSWWAEFPFEDPKPVLENDTEYVLTCWGDSAYSLLYYDNISESNGRYDAETYGTPPDPANFTNKENRIYSIFCSYTPEQIPPEITNVVDNPDIVGFGHNVTITANVTDNKSGVATVSVNVTYPDTSEQSFTMSNTEDDTYQYVFSDTWLVDQYNYTIWAVDDYGNENTSINNSFNVSANATISVCTVENEYGAGEDINITDPPAGEDEWTGFASEIPIGDPSLFATTDVTVTDDNTFITVDNGDGLVWKFRKDTGGYNEIYNDDTMIVAHEQWVLEYLHNNIWKQRGLPTDVTYEQPSSDYVIVTRSYTDYLGTTFDMVYEFVGGSRTKISFDGYIGEEDEYRLVWKTSGINTESVEVNGDEYNVRVWDGDDEGFTFDLRDVYESFGNIVQVSIDQSANNHKADIYFNVGELSVGEFVLDPSFGYTGGTTGNYDIEDKIAGFVATCPENGTADNITVALVGWNSGEEIKCVLYKKHNSSHYELVGETEELSSGGGNDWHTFEFTDKPIVYADEEYWICAVSGDPVFARTRAGYLGQMSHVHNHVYETEAPAYVDPDYDYSNWGMGVYCSYTPIIQISDPVPDDSATNISISSTVEITVSNELGNTMDLTWYSNSSGSWVALGKNVSVGNGTYSHVFSNASVNGQWWYWKVMVDDGTYTEESDVYRFYTGVQSKIVNTGSTNISGYLLIQVQYENPIGPPGDWIVDNDTINETTPRTINAGETLALDTIFNGNVGTGNLVNGDGTYRVYTAFRDEYGDVLVCDDATKMEAWYEFEVDTS